MMAGRYRPNPATDPRAALRAWLSEIAHRQFGKYRERARVRSRETLCDAYIELDVMVPVTLHVPAPDLLGIPPGTAATRVRRGVRHFVRAVIRWRRPRS